VTRHHRGEDPVLFAEPHTSEEVFNQHDFPGSAELQIAGAADDLDRPDSPVETWTSESISFVVQDGMTVGDGILIAIFGFRNSGSNFHRPP
jgi:hypothetical protein